MSITYLKIKIMSLAAEAKIIRREEKNWYGNSDTRNGLRNHRVGIVREEARHALIAYGYIRGHKYSDIEANPTVLANLIKVHTLVRRYGPDKKITVDTITAWAKEPEALAVAA